MKLLALHISLLLQFLMLQPMLVVGQPRIYVDIDASEMGDGSSWESAFRSLHQALEFAKNRAGEKADVWVAEGIYGLEDENGEFRSFTLVNNISIYGGFAGTETTVLDRDWDNHRTVLDGSGENSVVLADSVIATLDGLDIINGNGRGGGVLATNSHLLLRNLTISNNKGGSATIGEGGAGIYLELSTAQIENTTLESNEGGVSGAGATLLSSEVVMYNVSVLGNSARGAGYGGGMYMESSNLLVVDSNFRNNKLGANTAEAFGGAIFSKNSNLSVFSTIFEGNYVSGAGNSKEAGGAIYHVATADSINSVLANVLFVENLAIGEYVEATAGAIYAEGKPLSVVNATFVDNGNRARTQEFVTYYAGPIIVGPVVLLNSIVWGNRGTDPLKGITVKNSIVQGGYPGEAVWNTDPLFVNMISSDTTSRDLTLTFDSPAIDAGLIEHIPYDQFDLDDDGDQEELLPLDLSNKPRVQDFSIDLGAYESTLVDTKKETPEFTTFRTEAYPNPFKNDTSIQFEVVRPGSVIIVFYDILGRKVDEVVLTTSTAGKKAIFWDAQSHADGVYFYVLKSDAGISKGSLIKVK